MLCIVSPAPLIFLRYFLGSDSWASGLGVAMLLALVAAGCYLFTRTGCILSCYQRLLKR